MLVDETMVAARVIFSIAFFTMALFSAYLLRQRLIAERERWLLHVCGIWWSVLTLNNVALALDFYVKIPNVHVVLFSSALFTLGVTFYCWTRAILRARRQTVRVQVDDVPAYLASREIGRESILAAGRRLANASWSGEDHLPQA